MFFPILSAQDYLADVKFYNYENGLAGRYANCTFEDSRGLVWIGTQFGLNRFDGRDFLLFDEKAGLPFPQVMEIHEDDEGWLWLFRNCHEKESCTKNLAFLHSITHEIRNFQEWSGDTLSFMAENINSIIDDKKGGIIISFDKEVIRWSGSRITHRFEVSDADNTLHLLTTKENKLAGWYYRSKEDKSFIHYIVFDFNGKIHYEHIIYDKNGFEDKNRLILYGTDFTGRQMVGLKSLNPLNPPHFVIQEDGRLVRDTSAWTSFPNSRSLNYNPFQPLAWSDEGGLSVYILPEGLIYDFSDEFSELNNILILRDVRFDENEITWLSGRYGVFRIQFKPNLFKRILYNGKPDLRSPEKWLCWAVQPLGNKNFLLKSQLETFILKEDRTLLDIDDLKYHGVLSMSHGHEGDLWGVHKNTLLHIKVALPKITVQSQSLTKNKSHKKALSTYYRKDTLWIGTDQGLHFFDHIQKTLFEFEVNDEFKSLSNSAVHAFYENNDTLYICTSSGLYTYSFKKNSIVRFWVEGDGAFKLPAKEFYHISPAKKGGFWLACKEGLIYWNKAENVYEHFTIEDGLVSNEILAVYEDDYGFLWMPTNQGLIQYEIHSGLSKVWLEADGITSKDFELYGHYQEKDGTLWFGTTNGFNTFHPKDFKDLDFNVKADIPLNILNFEQYSTSTEKLEDRTLELLNTKQITLLPGEKFFNIRVALADYINGENASYGYYIEGYQDFWQEDKENLIRISGLPYGDFILKIRGRLASGQYSGQEIRLPISVIRPFYLKTWFFVTIIAFALLILFGLYEWRTIRLRRRQKKLEIQVKERTHIIRQKNKQLEADKQTIEEQTEALKDLDKVKSRFFANISHELRTPLTLILGPISTLLKNGLSAQNPSKLLETAQENGRTLLRLVNEILDLTKLESNKLELNEKPTVLYLLVYRIMSLFESHAERQSINFQLEYHVDRDLQISLDEDKFQKILKNLLSNAFKFTPKGGKIKVDITDAGSHINLQVEDTGRGIHSDDLPHIFDRFYQSAQPDTAAEGGTGIGLALCKEYAKLFNAKLSVESELGKGSRFTFTFPKKEVFQSLPDKAALELKSKKIVSSHQNVKAGMVRPGTLEMKAPVSNKDKALHHENDQSILIVEDNHSLRNYLESILGRHYNILSVENGQEAIECLADMEKQKEGNTNAYPSLIISDIMMPIMDGFQLLEKLKSNDIWRAIPVIMLTARAELSDKLKALRIGVDDYLTKPFEEEELLVRIANLLENYRERLDIQQTFSENSTLIKTPVMSQADMKWLEELEQLVKKHIDSSSLNLSLLTQHLFISERQIHRRINKLTGLTPNKYIREIKLQTARELLENRSYRTVSEVCHAVGFSKSAHFSNLYKQRFGKMPSSYLT